MKKLCCLVHPYSSKGLCRPCMIRKRQSYHYFKAWKDEAPPETVAELLWLIWELRDNYRTFRSAKNATKAYESIKQLIEDFGLDKRKL